MDLVGFMQDVARGLIRPQRGTPTMTLAPHIMATPKVRPDRLPVLALGVRGVRIDHERAAFFPYLIATDPGSGDMAAFLDGLTRTPGRWRFPAVISGKLADMLERRGFKCRWADVGGDVIDVWCLDVPHGVAP
jgi:hypothetical protein